MVLTNGPVRGQTPLAGYLPVGAAGRLGKLAAATSLLRKGQSLPFDGAKSIQRSISIYHIVDTGSAAPGSTGGPIASTRIAAYLRRQPVSWRPSYSRILFARPTAS